jgi:hypothetical protein
VPLCPQQIPHDLTWDRRGVKPETNRLSYDTTCIAQAVNRRLPTAAARVRAQVRSRGICGGQMTLGQVFSEYFGFPCQFSFHRLFHNDNLSSGAGTIGQTVADVPSGLSLNPTQGNKKWHGLSASHLTGM